MLHHEPRQDHNTETTPPAGGAETMDENLALDLDAVRFTGRDLMRPECVLATAAGDLYCCDWRGGIVHLHPDGRQQTYGGTPEVRPE